MQTAFVKKVASSEQGEESATRGPPPPPHTVVRARAGPKTRTGFLPTAVALPVVAELTHRRPRRVPRRVPKQRTRALDAAPARSRRAARRRRRRRVSLRHRRRRRRAGGLRGRLGIRPGRRRRRLRHHRAVRGHLGELWTWQHGWSGAWSGAGGGTEPHRQQRGAFGREAPAGPSTAGRFVASRPGWAGARLLQKGAPPGANWG